MGSYMREVAAMILIAVAAIITVCAASLVSSFLRWVGL